jgi:glycosyltransferase involved in cell wall biosynthesis
MSSQKIKAAPVSQEVSTIIPFTAIVVTYNEEARLRDCLESLSFCDQLVVVDLGSEDRSVEIAESCGAEVFHHERVPVVEHIRQDALKYARNEWIVFLDPDEVFNPELAVRAVERIEKMDRVGRVRLPWKFYFKGEPLQGTHWGGKKHKGILIHRERCRISEDVHRGIEVKETYQSVQVTWDDTEHHIRHYWMDSYSQLFEKHLRYVQQEGKSRFNQGTRFPGFARWGWMILRAFKRSYIDHGGWREGLRGLFLSLFWTWYQAASLLSLKRYQEKVDV